MNKGDKKSFIDYKKQIKECCNCHNLKPFIDYFKNKYTKSGINSWCKDCMRNFGKDYRKENEVELKKYNKDYNQKNFKKLSKKRKIYKKKNWDKVNITKIACHYNISKEEAAALWFKKQNGVCDICGNPETSLHPSTKNKMRLSIDHDHKTNKIRGLLCQFCNTGLGYFKDNVLSLQNATTYLQRNS